MKKITTDVLEGEPLPERFPDEWERLVGEWLAIRDVPLIARRLKDELARIRVESPDGVLRVSVSVLTGAVRAALQVDAQSLMAAAVRLKED